MKLEKIAQEERKVITEEFALEVDGVDITVIRRTEVDTQINEYDVTVEIENREDLPDYLLDFLDDYVEEILDGGLDDGEVAGLLADYKD